MMLTHLNCLPLELLYELADTYKALALACRDGQFLSRAKAIEELAGRQDVGARLAT